MYELLENLHTWFKRLGHAKFEGSCESNVLPVAEIRIEEQLISGAGACLCKEPTMLILLTALTTRFAFELCTDLRRFFGILLKHVNWLPVQVSKLSTFPIVVPCLWKAYGVKDDPEKRRAFFTLYPFQLFRPFLMQPDSKFSQACFWSVEPEDAVDTVLGITCSAMLYLEPEHIWKFYDVPWNILYLRSSRYEDAPHEHPKLVEGSKSWASDFQPSEVAR